MEFIFLFVRPAGNPIDLLRVLCLSWSYSTEKKEFSHLLHLREDEEKLWSQVKEDTAAWTVVWKGIYFRLKSSQHPWPKSCPKKPLKRDKHQTDFGSVLKGLLHTEELGGWGVSLWLILHFLFSHTHAHKHKITYSFSAHTLTRRNTDTRPSKLFKGEIRSLIWWPWAISVLASG